MFLQKSCHIFPEEQRAVALPHRLCASLLRRFRFSSLFRQLGCQHVVQQRRHAMPVCQFKNGSVFFSRREHFRRSAVSAASSSLHKSGCSSSICCLITFLPDAACPTRICRRPPTPVSILSVLPYAIKTTDWAAPHRAAAG